eukprot:357907-Chlamydomonas_euryale.AAC.6
MCEAITNAAIAAASNGSDCRNSRHWASERSTAGLPGSQPRARPGSRILPRAAAESAAPLQKTTTCRYTMTWDAQCWIEKRSRVHAG